MRSAPIVLATILLAAAQGIANANVIVPVTVDTSSLAGNPAGPFSLAFVLTDGSGSGDGNNTAMLTNFSFGGGSAGPVGLVQGGATGSLASSVTLTDSSFFNALVSSFTPGSSLSFVLTLTANVDPGATPDQFSFGALQADGSSVATTDPTGANTLLTIDVDSTNPRVAQFALASAAVPEPATVFLLLAGLLLGIRSTGGGHIRR